MAYDRFLIAPFDDKSGFRTNVKPWLVPDQAFEVLNNAYVFRGRIRKRFGTTWLGNTQLSSRLRVSIGTVAGAVFSGTVPVSAPLTPIVTPAIGQMFSIGSDVFTVNVLGNPADMLISGTEATAKYDTTTGAVNITGIPAPLLGSKVYFYPALPVMGLLTQEAPGINVEPVIGFDTKFAYQYVGSGWERIDGGGAAAVWNGSDSQFFWHANWVGLNASDNVFFVTNYNNAETQNMRYLVFGTTTWVSFAPLITGATNLTSARILMPFKNRLVALNTFENGLNYRARARYSQLGSPLDPDAFRQDIPAKGNFIDAATTEAIVSAEFVKDRLIVFFERSTWELVYTANEVMPFTWQQINTELGAESTFSIIPFDKVCIGIGNVGIEACNGINVDRIDSSIPTFVFSIHNDNDGVFRVYGVRDYYAEQLYWTIPSPSRASQTPYPDQVLVYNYTNGTWALNDDSITAFGYIQLPNGVLWSSQTVKWSDESSWDSGALQSNFKQVIGGNQEGYTFIVDTNASTQSPNLQITDIVLTGVVTITAINHNLVVDDYVYLQDIVGITALNNTIFQVTSTLQNSFTIDAPLPAGTYLGNGTIARVPLINIETKEYNFYGQQGRNMYVQKVDMMVDKTGNKDPITGSVVGAGSVLINSFVSTLNDPITPLIGNNILTTAAYPNTYEETTTRVVHSMYLWADGEFIQLQLTMNDDQMRDINVRQAPFQMHYMLFYVTPTTSRPQ